jgi:nitroimidazol reductase NimA-like FMN-containing flavoprotein (pyridoxamine 5'-phosphate oxidase superfamily)
VVARHGERQVDDRQVIRDILAAGRVAHVGFVRRGWPVVLPFHYGVGDLGDGQGEQLVIHGSTGGRGFLDAAASPQGVRVSVCVSLNDALVVGRSLYNIGAHYRSVVVYGRARRVPNDRRVRALDILVNHILPGRAGEVRPHRAKELAATALLAIGLDQASAKVARTSTGETADDGEDRSVWAGVVPLALRAGPPVAAPETAQPDDLPESVRAFIERWSA